MQKQVLGGGGGGGSKGFPMKLDHAYSRRANGHEAPVVCSYTHTNDTDAHANNHTYAHANTNTHTNKHSNA